jgi:hypothetical protein
MRLRSFPAAANVGAIVAASLPPLISPYKRNGIVPDFEMEPIPSLVWLRITPAAITPESPDVIKRASFPGCFYSPSIVRAD